MESRCAVCDEGSERDCVGAGGGLQTVVRRDSDPLVPTVVRWDRSTPERRQHYSDEAHLAVDGANDDAAAEKAGGDYGGYQRDCGSSGDSGGARAIHRNRERTSARATDPDQADAASSGRVGKSAARKNVWPR